MYIPLVTIPSLNAEGIININDLAEFNKEAISAIFSDFCRQTPAVLFGAKSQQCLAGPCDDVIYFEDIDRHITTITMVWDTVLKKFKLQWDTLVALKDKEDPETHKHRKKYVSRDREN